MIKDPEIQAVAATLRALAKLPAADRVRVADYVAARARDEAYKENLNPIPK